MRVALLVSSESCVTSHQTLDFTSVVFRKNLAASAPFMHVASSIPCGCLHAAFGAKFCLASGFRLSITAGVNANTALPQSVLRTSWYIGMKVVDLATTHVGNSLLENMENMSNSENSIESRKEKAYVWRA